MTQYDPSIALNRLVVYKEQRIVYDERFNKGINVIRGENSSGKSTILNLIYFALGGELTDWSDHALQCTRVVAEAQFNGKIATLSRDISSERQRPMDIFGGRYLDSLLAPRESWVRYPYARHSTKESFSQVLYRLLGLPEVANESSGNLTIHQIYRLLYSDQLSATGSLFKHDPTYDNPLIRDSVGRLLCGAYDQEIYHRRLRIRELEKQFDRIAGELRSIYSFLGSENVTVAHLDAETNTLDAEEKELAFLLQEAEKAMFEPAVDEGMSLKAYNEAYVSLQRAQTEVDEARSEQDGLELEIADSDLFIANLELKLSQLTDARAISQHIDEIRFHSCPACNTPITEEVAEHACHLCKSPFDPDRARMRIVATINDVALQLKQSKLIQADRHVELEATTRRVTTSLSHWRQNARLLEQLKSTPMTEMTGKLKKLNQRAGYLERLRQDLARKRDLVAQIAQKQNTKSQIASEMAALNAANDDAQASQASRMAKAAHVISEEVKTLLKNDLPRQDSFRDPQRVDINFADNNISVDGKVYFSASSRVILKNSFILGFLSAATKNRFFRHPRFCIVDTIEDKGMEEKRSWNFQVQVTKLSNAAPSEHQIIFATAMPSPELEDFAVGKFSTLENPTLELDASPLDRPSADHAEVWRFVKSWLEDNLVTPRKGKFTGTSSDELERFQNQLIEDALLTGIDRVSLEDAIGLPEDVISEFIQSLNSEDDFI